MFDLVNVSLARPGTLRAIFAIPNDDVCTNIVQVFHEIEPFSENASWQVQVGTAKRIFGGPELGYETSMAEFVHEAEKVLSGLMETAIHVSDNTFDLEFC